MSPDGSGKLFEKKIFQNKKERPTEAPFLYFFRKKSDFKKKLKRTAGHER